MDKKYQIFISSTYLDLKEIRGLAFLTILKMGHIPVGVDMADVGEEYTTEKYAGKYIDSSQLMILIIGHRYGTPSKHGVGYVYEEYKYAMSKKKPVLIFINHNYRSSEDRRLNEFVKELSANQVVIYWDDTREFKAKLMSGLSSFITSNPPSIYWQKTSNITDFNSENYFDDLSKIITSNSKEDNLDILGLMLYNIKEIKEFYILTKQQAKKAFRLSVWMCIAGFILFAGAIAAAIIFKEDQITTLATIGGIVTELIAGTSLFVYRRSLEQLNYYYDSLHDNERFLSLINISGKAKNEDELYSDIVHSELERFKICEQNKQNDKE